jgi:hypothetical protein
MLHLHSWQLSVNASVPCQHDPTEMNSGRMCSAEYPCGNDGCADVIIWDGWTVRAMFEKSFVRLQISL